MITIALTKGRIEKDTVKILAQAGFDMGFMADKGRNLIFIDQAQDLRFLLVKAPDVSTYVEHVIADLGVLGSDVLYEHARRAHRRDRFDSQAAAARGCQGPVDRRRAHRAGSEEGRRREEGD